MVFIELIVLLKVSILVRQVIRARREDRLVDTSLVRRLVSLTLVGLTGLILNVSLILQLA